MYYHSTSRVLNPHEKLLRCCVGISNTVLKARLPLLAALYSVKASFRRGDHLRIQPYTAPSLNFEFFFPPLLDMEYKFCVSFFQLCCVSTWPREVWHLGQEGSANRSVSIDVGHNVSSTSHGCVHCGTTSLIHSPEREFGRQPRAGYCRTPWGLDTRWL